MDIMNINSNSFYDISSNHYLKANKEEERSQIIDDKTTDKTEEKESSSS